jgi:hypothetical protein
MSSTSFSIYYLLFLSTVVFFYLLIFIILAPLPPSLVPVFFLLFARVISIVGFASRSDTTGRLHRRTAIYNAVFPFYKKREGKRVTSLSLLRISLFSISCLLLFYFLSLFFLSLSPPSTCTSRKLTSILCCKMICTNLSFMLEAIA